MNIFHLLIVECLIADKINNLDHCVLMGSR